MMEKEMEKLIQAKLVELCNAIDRFFENTVPNTPLPRLKKFKIHSEIRLYAEKNYHFYLSVQGWNYSPRLRYSFDDIAHSIVKLVGHNPRELLRIMRRIEAATQWFLKRAEGRKKMAMDILKAQNRFVEILEAEAALVSLSK